MESEDEGIVGSGDSAGESVEYEGPSNSILNLFDTSVFNDIVAAQVTRDRNELALDYGIVAERIKNLDIVDDELGYDTLVAKEALVGLKTCAGISDDLQISNDAGIDLLEDLENVIDDLLFRLETINHAPNESEEEEDEVEEYDEKTAQRVIMALFDEASSRKQNVQGNIITCNATLSKLKMEISELIGGNPRARRMSRNFGMLGKMSFPGFTPNQPRKQSAMMRTPEPVEEFIPTKEVTPLVEELMAFIKDQELTEEEMRPAQVKINTLAKTIQHFKVELKAANQKATEDMIKFNNLQTKLPKLEESRVRLSQQAETLNDKIRERDTEVAKLKMKLKSSETRASKTMEAGGGEEGEAVREKVKQPIIPKSVLKEIMQTSDKDLDNKLAQLASSNDAIRVVLVRKNKQIRQLEGMLIQRNSEMRGLKTKVTELQDSIVAGTANAETIIQQKEEEADGTSPSAEPSPSPGPIPSLESQLTDGLSSAAVESNGLSSPSQFDDVVTVEFACNTDNPELEEVGTQTDEHAPTPELEQISFKMTKKGRRRSTVAGRRGSVMSPEAGIRRASVMRTTVADRRRSSLAPQDIFGIASAKHHMTTADLATIEEFDRGNVYDDRTVKQVEDIAILQKYIASMREQSEKAMEKVREFIAKEKQRNEATTRKLINEHEKVLANHKKEINKIVYSISRFKDMVTEILNGKDITQIILSSAFKYESSPLQLRMKSTELLSSMEFEIYQALKERDMKIRDLSGRKRLDDKDLDRRIKEREKTVFSLLDYTNEKLRKEKERVTQREQWVNKKIKTELQFEKQKEQEVQTIEKALVRFWKEYGVDGNMAPTVDMPALLNPDTTPRSTDNEDPEEPIEAEDTISPARSRTARRWDSTWRESVIPKLFIKVSNQRNNLIQLDIAHRAGMISNLAHKIITNIILRWLECTEQKLQALFKAYVKFRRYSQIQTCIMNQEPEESGVHDMDRAMTLHRRIRDALDLQYKKLHVELGKLSGYCTSLLEEEGSFFDAQPDPRANKNIIRPGMLQLNHNAMLKKIMAAVPKARELVVTFPHMTYDQDGQGAPQKEDILPTLKSVANKRQGGNWNTDQKEASAKSLLIPRIMQIDTNPLAPVRLQKPPLQSTQQSTQHATVRRHTSGLPPIPIFSPLKSSRISYLPNIASVWSCRKDSSSTNSD